MHTHLPLWFKFGFGPILIIFGLTALSLPIPALIRLKSGTLFIPGKNKPGYVNKNTNPTQYWIFFVVICVVGLYFGSKFISLGLNIVQH